MFSHTWASLSCKNPFTFLLLYDKIVKNAKGCTMENLPEVISLLDNITRDFDYPLAMMTQELEILWFNDKAKTFFKRKKSMPTSLSHYAVSMNTRKTIETLRSGTSCEFKAKNRVGKKIYVFETGYCERHLFLAAWVDEDNNAQIEHERHRIEMLIFQHNCKLAIQRLFNATTVIEHSKVLNGDPNLMKSFSAIEREAYRLYLMLGDLQIVHKDMDPFAIDSTRKFDFTQHFNELISATTLSLAPLGVNIAFTTSVLGIRYVNANPHYFSMSFLRLLKAVVMLMDSKPKNVRVMLDEDADGCLLLKIIANGTRLLHFLSDEQCSKGFVYRGQNIDNFSYAYAYKIAETIIRRNNMFLSTELDGSTTTVCVKIPATEDPKGVLRSMKECYLGNKFSTINLVFGDMM